MLHGNGWFFGMHIFWWFFWVAIVVGVVALLRSAPRRTERREDARALLRERYAAWEISEEEYEERKRVLDRD